jgi:hypothetical protein
MDRGALMPVSPEQASEALDLVADVQARSKTLYGYWRGAPHLILWGVLWMMGFGLADVFPSHVTIIWSVVTPVGIAAGIVIDRYRDDERASRDWKYAIIMLAFAAFFFAAFAVMKPHDPNQASAFICLVVALIYVLMGLWFGVRYIAGGMLIAALTLAGFFLLHSHFSLWMASIGGSALIFTGLWLRKP